VPGRPPLVVLLAGPNGAGKSTAAARLLRGAYAVEEFVNADTIATGLSAYRPESAAVAAARVMLGRLRYLAHEKRDFAFETKLAGRGHAARVSELRNAGYQAHIVFLWLPDEDLAVARVADRVRQGGHDVPEDVIRRRYRVGLHNLFSVYLPLMDSWQVYDNSDVAGPRLIAACDQASILVVADPGAWERLEQSR
jgi:predicted ABC-type ATPase